MSYMAMHALERALRQAILARLLDDTVLAALVGDAVRVEKPCGTVIGTYVNLGPMDAQPASDTAGVIFEATFDFVISVITDDDGFARADLKAAALAVADAILADTPIVLAHGGIEGLWFLKARFGRTVISGAERGKSQIDTTSLRWADLSFRARVTAVGHKA